MPLTWTLDTLTGVRLCQFTERENAEVAGGLNAPRTAKLDVSLEDPRSAFAREPLYSVLSVTFDREPLFRGKLLTPVYKGTDRVVEINAIDPSFNLQCAHTDERSDGAYFTKQYAVDQSEIKARLMEHVLPTAAEAAAGTPPHGIRRGSLPATVARDLELAPGVQIWQSWLDLTELEGGADLELRPLAAFEGFNYVALDTFARQGSDKSATAIYQFNLGKSNCGDFQLTPAGEEIRNRMSVSGTSERGLTPPVYRSDQPESQRAIGIYSDYDSQGDDSALSVLQARARERVATGAFAPAIFDITPAVAGKGYYRDRDQNVRVRGGTFGTPPSFGPGAGFDCWQGDTVRAVARVEPGLDVDLRGRITDWKISEVGDDVLTDLTCAPSVRAAGVT